MHHVNRLRLIATAHTPALRRAAFGGDDPLDPAGHHAAQALRTHQPRDTWTCAPSQAARQTAYALGADPTIDPALTDPDYGTWTGHTLDQIDPAALHHWLTDPDAAPHGGEPLTAVWQRTGTWLDQHTRRRLTAVAHPVIVRAALAYALELPAHGIWRLDIAPLTTVRLTHRAGRWHLHLNPPRPTPQ